VETLSVMIRFGLLRIFCKLVITYQTYSINHKYKFYVCSVLHIDRIFLRKTYKMKGGISLSVHISYSIIFP
jgi:hypothetical protein